jgi:hypothetical protein
VPLGGLVERHLQDQAGQRVAEPGFLGERDEVVGRDQAEVGVLPADQGFDPVDLAGGRVEGRLVVQDELAVFDRGEQGRL